MEIVLLVGLLVVLAAVGGGIYLLSRKIAHMNETLSERVRQEVKNELQGVANLLYQSQQQVGTLQNERLKDLTDQLSKSQHALNESVSDMVKKLDNRMASFSLQNEEKLDQMRATLRQQVGAMQEDNHNQLEKIRATVDEKLQKTLEERIGESFKQVSERLEQVYKGLGEMQTLASGVGDLKKVLSNVKTRGILGEIQLGAILEQILSPEQYLTNVATVPGSKEVVEFAIRLPGDGETPVLLPIDAKFPADAYQNLLDAYEMGDSGQVAEAGKVLDQRMKQFAKDIHTKYVSPPYTTDFAILFLPVEGLYAEVVKRGLVETLQNEYKVNIAGPTTMAALLNSLQMGFQTLAIQKRSGEVWKVLGEVKTEFQKFAEVLSSTQKRLEMAHSDLDKLIGTRTNQILRKLRDVEALPAADAISFLSEEEDG